MSSKWILAIVIIILFVLAAILWPFGGSIIIHLDNGAEITVSKASSMKGSRDIPTSKLYYKPEHGEGGTIHLLRTLIDSPVTLIASTNTHSLLCLYDADIDLVLIRIEVLANNGSLAYTGGLSKIVLSSTWPIARGTTDDWAEILGYLKRTSDEQFRLNSIPKFKLGIINVKWRRAEIIALIEERQKVPAQFKGASPY